MQKEIELIDKSEKHESIALSGIKFWIGEQTVRDIIKAKDSIRNYAASINYEKNILSHKKIAQISVFEEIYRHLDGSHKMPLIRGQKIGNK